LALAADLNKGGRVEDGVPGLSDLSLFGDDDATRALAAVQARTAGRAGVVVVDDVGVSEGRVEGGGNFSEVVEGVRLGEEDAVFAGRDEALHRLVVDGQAQQFEQSAINRDNV
jgi:hypothetical protein